MQARRNLTVIRAAERPRILPGHTDRMAPLLGKPGIVQDEGRRLGQIALDQAREPVKQRASVPGAHHHAWRQPLPHRLDLIGALDQARHDRLNALPLAIEQEAADVLRHCRPTLGTTEVCEQGVDESGQLTIQLLQRVGVTAARDHEPIRASSQK